MTPGVSTASRPTRNRPTGEEVASQSGLTVGDQVLGDVQGDLDNEGAADVRGAHQADGAAGDADQHQGGLVHGTARGAHWK